MQRTKRKTSAASVSPLSFTDLHDYLAAAARAGKPIKKVELARLLSDMTGRPVGPWIVTFLLNPRLYPGRVAVDDVLADAIATLLNQKPEYVRRLYAA